MLRLVFWDLIGEMSARFLYGLERPCNSSWLLCKGRSAWSLSCLYITEGKQRRSWDCAQDCLLILNVHFLPAAYTSHKSKTQSVWFHQQHNCRLSMQKCVSTFCLAYEVKTIYQWPTRHASVWMGRQIGADMISIPWIFKIFKCSNVKIFKIFKDCTITISWL